MSAKRKPMPDIKTLYYITHIDNVPSMLAKGILSHAEMERQGVTHTPIYDKGIVSNRKEKRTPDGRSLWDYANVYFNARNPMLYRVKAENGFKDLAILGVKPQVMDTPGAFLTDGNAANTPTEFYTSKEGREVIAENWPIITSEWWNSSDGSKRKIMAECLVPERITPDMIQTIYAGSHEVGDRIRKTVGSAAPIAPEPNLFFRPTRMWEVTPRLRLADGDMFFSDMQTLTISVNVVGIMGKGLASRAKYQFPDVYVAYQDACKSKKLKMGKPFLYKREASLDEELADDATTMRSLNAEKWFLLFATKSHWREDSDLPGIELGLKWLVDNYRAQGMKSLAMPALGCGLGKLDWKDVGPVMCRHLARMDIDTRIFLPREREIPEAHLRADFLLGKR